MPTGIIYLITSPCLSAHLLSRNIVLTYFPDYHEGLLLLVKPYTLLQKTTHSEKKKSGIREFSPTFPVCMLDMKGWQFPESELQSQQDHIKKMQLEVFQPHMVNLGCHKRSRRSGLAATDTRYRKYHCWLSRQLFLLNQQSLNHCSAKAHDTFRKKKNT